MLREQKGKTARNGKIEFLRFLFSIIIVLHHSRYVFGDANCLFLGGSFGVEFFFLVSGYLMMATLEKISARKESTHQLGQETLGFLWKKAKSLFPDLLIAWVIALLFTSYAKNMSVFKTAALAVDSFYEVTLLKMSGLPADTVNGVTWYVSSMLLCMAVLYPLIRKFPDMMKHIGLPLVVVLSLGYLAGEYGEPRNPTKWIGFTTKGNLRALGELALGAISYQVVKAFLKVELSRFGKILVTVAEWCAYILLILYMYYAKATIRDYFFIFVMAVAVMLSFSHKGIDAGLFDNGLCSFLGKWSLPLYLGHTFYAYHLKRVLPEDVTDGQKWLLYLGLTVVTSFAIWGLSIVVKKLMPAVTKSVKRLIIKKTDA